MPEKSTLFDLTGRIALVTGSSQGLGLSIARGLAQHGATVVVNGRSKEAVDEVAAGLKAQGFTAHASVFDVTDAKSVNAAVDGSDTQPPTAYDYRDLRRAVIGAQSRELQRLYETNQISSTIRRRIQRTLDLEETRLTE